MVYDIESKLASFLIFFLKLYNEVSSLHSQQFIIAMIWNFKFVHYLWLE